MTGAAFGLMVLLVDKNLIPVNRTGEFLYAVLVALTIVAVIYVTLLLHKRDASYFSCVVFLSIVVIHIGDANPYLFVFNRVMDTMIGIIIGMLVNSATFQGGRKGIFSLFRGWTIRFFLPDSSFPLTVRWN